MTYNELLRPLFSYVAHVCRTLADNGNHAVSSDEILRDLECLAEEAMLRPGATEAGFATAWFAFAVWAADATTAWQELSEKIKHRFSLPSDSRVQFFKRLNALLSPGAAEIPDQERLAALETFACCLRFGFARKGATPLVKTRLEDYRRRCLAVLPPRPTTDEAPDFAEPPPPRPVNPLAAALWIAPAIATILLYAVYRTLLSGLYAGVVG